MAHGSPLEHGRAEPLARLQGEFHVVAVIAHRPAETLLRLADPSIIATGATSPNAIARGLREPAASTTAWAATACW
jgi:hypothetical protein